MMLNKQTILSVSYHQYADLVGGTFELALLTFELTLLLHVMHDSVRLGTRPPHVDGLAPRSWERAKYHAKFLQKTWLKFACES